MTYVQCLAMLTQLLSGHGFDTILALKLFERCCTVSLGYITTCQDDYRNDYSCCHMSVTRHQLAEDCTDRQQI